MPLITAARGAQAVMESEFIFSFNDTMRDINGVLKTFGSAFGDAGVFDVVNMPAGAVIVGGSVLVETAGVGPTAYTVTVGTAASPAGILAATSLLTAARTALTGLGLLSNDGSNVRITIASTVANATAGKVRIRVHYTIDNRMTEVNPN